MLPEIAMKDLGQPGEPGEYPFGAATVQVERRHVDAWRGDPSLRFHTILRTRAGDKSVRFVLGSPVEPLGEH